MFNGRVAGHFYRRVACATHLKYSLNSQVLTVLKPAETRTETEYLDYAVPVKYAEHVQE
jgi:hypothetical protein